ncbi:hypothetical protein ACFRMQ_02855, partial [Kitasatospora sp. NPDC056783]
MRRRIYGPDHDPVSRHLGEDVIGPALETVLGSGGRTLLLHLLHGAPISQIAKQARVPASSISDYTAHQLERLAASEHAQALREELSDPHGPRYSPEVWASRNAVPIHRCERKGCPSPPFTQPATGRPRRFCGNACRQAAYRARKPAESVAATAPTAAARTYRLTSYSDAPPQFPARMVPWGKRWFAEYMRYLDRTFEEWSSPPAPSPQEHGRIGMFGVGMRSAIHLLAPLRRRTQDAPQRPVAGDVTDEVAELLRLVAPVSRTTAPGAPGRRSVLASPRHRILGTV